MGRPTSGPLSVDRTVITAPSSDLLVVAHRVIGGVPVADQQIAVRQQLQAGEGAGPRLMPACHDYAPDDFDPTSRYLLGSPLSF